MAEFDRWYSQEMRAPDGGYIKRLQDLPASEWRRLRDVSLWAALFEREMFGTIHGAPVPLPTPEGAQT